MSVSARAAIILPARYHSTRFPGKPLAVIAGKPLIQWVYERACEIHGVRVVVATDHDNIAEAARSFGAEVAMTSSDHATGTDRVAAVARDLEEDVIVNIQGDEPLFPHGLVEEMIALAAPPDNSPAFPTPDDSLASPIPDIVTAYHRIKDDTDIHNRNVVKVVMDRRGNAIYFSRSPIPSARDKNIHHYRHVGIYVFRRDSLVRFSEFERTPLEKAESLEQLRALENGMTIKLVETSYSTLGVDTPEDIKSVEKALASAYSL